MDDVHSMKRVTVSKENNVSIRHPKEGEYNEKDRTAFHAIYADLEKGEPQVVIELENPATVHYLYGFMKKTEKIYLKLDRPDEFLAAVEEEGFCKQADA